MSTGDRIVAFVLQDWGHNPGFVLRLAEYWIASHVANPLDVVVRPSFVRAHATSISTLETAARDRGVRIIPIREEEEAVICREDSRIMRLLSRCRPIRIRTRLRMRRLREWHVCAQYAEQLQADRCLFLNFDWYHQLPAVGFRFPCAFSGVYHHLSMHYPAPWMTLNAKERLRGHAQWWMVKRVARHPDVGTLFCLDPFAVDYVKRSGGNGSVVYLPVPAGVHRGLTLEERENKRCALGIGVHRRVFLLFGGVSRRKGIDHLLAALYLLPPEVARRAAILLVGRHEKRDDIEHHIQRLQHLLPIQIISIDGFVPEDDVSTYFELADVVLAIHPRHCGISMSVVHAAKAGKPVLASRHGVLGELVRRHRLGRAVDASSPQALRQGICAYADPDATRANESFDSASARRFGNANSAEAYARTIVEHMTS